MRTRDGVAPASPTSAAGVAAAAGLTEVSPAAPTARGLLFADEITRGLE
jgi:hypothetical protein